MSSFKNREIREIANFNPSERIAINDRAKKIPMGFLQEYCKKINGYEFSEYKSGPKFRNGDVLLAKITPCLENGKTAFVDILDDDEVAFGSSEFIVLRAKENADNEYLYYLARSPAFRKKAISCMEGTSGRKRVNEGVLKLQELLIPEKSDQQKIAAVLSALDAKIELNNRINTELEAMVKTLYDFWFVQFDFLDQNGKPYKSSGGKMAYNEILKREIPQGWSGENILAVAELFGGGTPSKKKVEYWNGEIPFFTPTDADPNVFKISTDEFITVDGLKNSSSRLFSKGTVFITARGSVGKLMIAANDMAMNQSCYALKARPNINYSYLYYAAKELIHFLKVKSSGSVFNSIVSNDIKHTFLVIPTSKVIKDFSDKVEPVFEKILLNTRENQQLTQLRDWLLPMLMNGQVTVK